MRIFYNLIVESKTVILRQQKVPLNDGGDFDWQQSPDTHPDTWQVCPAHSMISGSKASKSGLCLHGKTFDPDIMAWYDCKGVRETYADRRT